MAQKILVVDDKQAMRDSVAAILQRAGFLVVTAPDGATAVKMARKHEPTAVITDLSMPNMTGLELLDELRSASPALPIVLMTAFGGVTDAVSAMKAGAFDFIQKPFEGDALLSVMKRAVAAAAAAADEPTPRTAGPKRSAGTRASKDPLASIIGESPAMRRVKAQLAPVAASDATVLIQGESGTGKEVVARACHAASPRREKVLLCLNCAALSSSLLESELFGHERGAFTGADSERKGRFELADGGTLFLDEVSEIDPTLQAKLLRVLQEGQFERVGSSTTRTVDVRVIATTNRDLTRSVADGSFRQDLYYRLNVLPVELPALRERPTDVPALAAHFLRGIAQRSGSEPKRLTADAAALLCSHAWPGNVRELQNLCERAAVLGGEELDAGLFRPWLASASQTPASTAAPAGAPTPEPGSLRLAAGTGSPALQAPDLAHLRPVETPEVSLSLPPLGGPGDSSCHGRVDPEPCEERAGEEPAVRPLEEIEREKILAALDHFGGNRTRAAAALGIGLRTLGVKLKKWKEDNLVPATV